jgi:hypothetical protein
MRTALRIPLVVFAYGVDLLRRLPGSDRVRRWMPGLTRALFLAALGFLLVWASTKTPQRISLSDIEAGKLSQMQSWIIVTGDLREERSFVPEWRFYRITDPSAPGPSLIVRSTVPLRVGPTTISGHLDGGQGSVDVIKPWVGSLRADMAIAHEIPPPWGAVALALAGLLLGVARATTYPMFFRDSPRSGSVRAATVSVALRRGARSPRWPITPAKIVLGSVERPDVELVAEGAAPVSLRVHSEFTGAAAGELRTLTWSQPAILLRQAAEDVTLGFASTRDRDAVWAALLEGARALTAVPGARRSASPRAAG